MTAHSASSAAPDRLSEELFHVRHQALLRAIIDNISEGISIADASGRWIYTSAFAERIYQSGGPANEVPASELTTRFGIFRADGQTVFPAEDLPVWQALKGQEARDVHMVIRNASTPNGLHIRCTCIPLFNEQGELLGAMALTQDVDKQRQMEAEQRRSEQRFRVMVETAQEGVWTIDAEARTNYVNQYMASMLGYTVQEMLGKPLYSFLDEEGWQQARKNLDRQGQAPRGEVKDFRFLRKDGSIIWTSLSTTPLFDEQGRYLGSLAMVTDITQRRAAEEQVRQLNAELERRILERTAQLEFSNRELEAFAYTVAHDLRTPLRSIASFSDALVEDCGAQIDEVGQDYLRRIVGGARRMSELIDGILALSRVNSTALNTRPCDLSAMARAVLDQLQQLQPERTVRLSVQEGLVEPGDPQLLRTVFENLLGNAWKFTRERPEAEIAFSATRDEKGVRTYQVRDNGAGFDMAYREKLFGVFQRLHTQQEFEGNGVGLAAVQRIIRRHGGRIWAEGQPGQGATFFFTLNEFPLPPGTSASLPPRK
jgi:PAS domain S-box-containing protein